MADMGDSSGPETEGMEVTRILPLGMEVTGGIFSPETDSEKGIPEQLIGYLSFRSENGSLEADISEFAYGMEVTNDPLGIHKATEPRHRTIARYRATDDDRVEAERKAVAAGLTVLARSDLGIAVAGTPEQFLSLTRQDSTTEIVTRERLMYAEMGRERYVTGVDLVGDDEPDDFGVARAQAPEIEAILLERPRLPHRIFPSPLPPSSTKFHLRVPDDVGLALGAQVAHRAGFTGNGVHVAMVDTGQYAHPFFRAHGYDVRPVVALVPGTDPTDDPVGHGTGESANIFATAPGAVLHPYRATDNGGNLVAALAGFMRAKEDGPQVLTNSWGGDVPFPPAGPPDAADRMFALEIADAIEKGIVVVFSGGNGQFSIEPQVPGVLAAGGVFAGPRLDLTASNYASGYRSPATWFPGVTVPTVCGLVGLVPRAQYLMLPVQPGCEIDVAESVATVDDPADGTNGQDGWALFSGTSAAAPQLAGAAAIVIEALQREGVMLTPAQVIEALTSSATDITSGRCHSRFNNLAGPGRDLATGFGLVNVSRAVGYALTHFSKSRWIEQSG